MSSIRGVNVGGNLFDVTDSSNVAPIETTNFASRAYAKDRCFIMADGLLYRATAEIESGDPIVINGNCKRTTLDEIISVIKTDNDLIAPTEDGAISSDDYAVGDEIVRSGILYNVISAIAEGDAFIIGNNIDIAGSLTSQIKTLTNQASSISDEIADTNNILGAKNICPNNATSQVVNGITFTVNGDGTVTANGTATADTNFTIINQVPVADLFDIAGNYKVVLDFASDSNLQMFFGCHYNDSWIINMWFDKNRPTTQAFTILKSQIDGGSNYVITMHITVASGVTVSNERLSFMIVPDGIEDDTYVPYAMTNSELTTRSLGVGKVARTVNLSAAITMTSGQWYSPLSITLGRGIYLVFTRARFGISATGARTTNVRTDPNARAGEFQFAVLPSGSCDDVYIKLITVSSDSETYYFNVQQTSGANLDLQVASMQAIQLA